MIKLVFLNFIHINTPITLYESYFKNILANILKFSNKANVELNCNFVKTRSDI